jgi:P22 coat protein - gene protein 5
MNQLLTISMVTNEALRVLKNNLTFSKHINRQYDGMFGVDGAKIGTTLNVRKPVRYIAADGPALVIQDITETTVPVVLNHQPQIGISFTSTDLKLSIDEFSKRLIQPAVAQIANKIDYLGLQLYQGVYNFVGTPGTIPQDLNIYLNSQAALNNNACPMDGQRHVVITPLMEAQIVFALKGLFQSSTQIKEQYEKGSMGTAAGYDWSMDQNIWTHITGNPKTGSNPTVTTAPLNGATSITVSGFTAGATLNVGDILQFAGSFGVNPQNYQATTTLQGQSVTAPVALTGTNDVIPVTPGFTLAGPYQNVSAAPAVNAAVTFFGNATGSAMDGMSGGVSTPAALGFHPDAFTLACADLPLPNGVDMAARASDPDVGLSLRMLRQYDINTDKWPCRVDVLIGWALLRPELAVRIQS